MNVTLISLEALILKATHESLPCPDAAALEAFCAVMRDSVEGQQLAAQAFAARIHSLNPREALLALTMLDRCMRRCDAAFHAEIGKFRFLNEMIKLVSPKYFANRTAPDVKTRVLQLLHAWSIEYPKEAKFKVAYEMLKNQGVVKETPPPLPPEDVMSPPKNRAKSAIFENEEKSKLLQKLLQSKKPEDLQHANRLIKTMVKEEERRTEESSRRALEVGAALDSAGLLREMLARAADASPDEHQLIHELHASCLTLRPVLQTLAASEAQADNISDILHASDILDEVFEQYNVFVINEREKATPGVVKTETSNSDSLLDFATANVGRGDEKAVKPVPTKNVVIDELGDIFSTESASSNVAEPLKPVNLMQSGDLNLLGDKPNKKEGWNELDSLGDQLMKQSLPDNMQRIESFNSKSTRKVPMNALTSPKHKEQPINNGVLFDLDFFIKKPEDEIKTTAPPAASSPTDDAIVDISTDLPSTSINNVSNNSSNNPLENILGLCLHTDNLKGENNSSIENEMRDVNYVAEQVRKESCKKQHNDVKSLSDIHVTLDSVQPSQVPPMTVFEEDGGVSVVLHFCRDKPRPDVNVIVISTTSKNKSPIQDYKFQSVVPKGCKVRLLTASGASLPAYNPFLPPPALTQVMLIARPTPSPPIALKFVITYTCEDDMCSEMGEVKQLPLDDV